MAVYHAIQVATRDVKQVKTLLEASNLLNKHIKVQPNSSTNQSDSKLVVTNIEASEEPNDGNELLQQFHSTLDERYVRYEKVVFQSLYNADPPRDPLQRALAKAVSELSTDFARQHHDLLRKLLENGKHSYCIYRPMLLLSDTYFRDSGLAAIMQGLITTPEFRARFLQQICVGTGTTCIAVNAPIAGKNIGVGEATMSANILRSPTNLVALYGDFGPSLPPPPVHLPSSEDFEKARWVSTQQNGIVQCWAPCYTMFSQGNVSEKSRLLHLSTVRKAVQDGRNFRSGCAAVDLFAGIGYFAFSYVMAGVDRVFCWDLNPWSVEGLRRGSIANGWSCVNLTELQTEDAAGRLVQTTPSPAPESSSAQIVTFNESNIRALDRIEELRSTKKGLVPPIRHVNAGMLPTAAEAWKTAVMLIDPYLGGWVHLHESVPQHSIDDRAAAICKLVTQEWVEATLPDSSMLASNDRPATAVRLEHVEKVKSMGPKLSHIVVDVWVPPKSVDSMVH